MIKKLLFLFVFFSFITHPIGDYETGNAVMRRLTYSDLFGALALLLGIVSLYKSFKLSARFSPIYYTAFILLASFFFPIVFSLNMPSTLVESMIILFLILISLLIFITYKDTLFTSLLPLVINTALAASVLGFYDLIADMYGLPRIFKQRTNAELISGFRNAGQAGAYFMVFLAILIPLRSSKLKRHLSRYQLRKLNLAILVSIIFLFATGKIAAYVGFAIGMGLFVLFQRSAKNFLILAITVVLLLFTYNNLETIAPDLSKRLQMRIRTRVIEQVDGTSNSSFFEDNWGGAIKAFYDRPFTGTGIGAYYGNYGRYEVHSTYLKMIGETGIIGLIGYLIFIVTFILLFRVPKQKDNPYFDYLDKMKPFIFGSLVSWSYTYHLRKREFWLLVAIVVIVLYQAKIYDYKKLKTNE